MATGGCLGLTDYEDEWNGMFEKEGYVDGDHRRDG